MRLLLTIASVAAGALLVGHVASADEPKTPEKKTIPGTGGYVWGSGPPATPPKTPPAAGGVVGGQYPPDKGPTKVKCTHNGKEVPC